MVTGFHLLFSSTECHQTGSVGSWPWLKCKHVFLWHFAFSIFPPHIALDLRRAPQPLWIKALYRSYMSTRTAKSPVSLWNNRKSTPSGVHGSTWIRYLTRTCRNNDEQRFPSSAHRARRRLLLGNRKYSVESRVNMLSTSPFSFPSGSCAHVLQLSKLS